MTNGRQEQLVRSLMVMATVDMEVMEDMVMVEEDVL